jgi:hypothetical protein
MKAIKTYRTRGEAELAKRILDGAAVLSLAIPDAILPQVYLFVPEELACHAANLLERAERAKAA